MSKIIATFDTKDKTLTVTQDGTAVDNISGVYLGKGYCCDDEDEFRLELMTATKNDDEDYYTVTRLVATESDAGQKLTTTPESKEVPGFKVAEVSNAVETDVANFFKKVREEKKNGR